MQPSDEDDDDVQAIRLTSQDRTIHITTHQDPSSGKIIVLWNDVLRVFPDALYLQRGKRVLPFLKGADFEDLRPPRIAAIPGAVIDVIVKDELKQVAAGQQQEGPTTTLVEAPPQPIPAISIATATSTVKRNPAYGDELAALENNNHIDPPSNIVVERNSAYGTAGAAIDNNSSSTHIDKPRDAAVARNPAYGDKSTALENCDHIDIPSTSARGPQFHPEEALTCGDESPQRDTPKTETIRQGLTNDKDDSDTGPTLSKQDPTVVKPHNNVVFLDVYHGRGIGGMPMDYGLAMESYLKAAEQGNSETAYNIGQLGVPRDSSEAFKWYLLAAEQGHPDAQLALGEYYDGGTLEVPRDYSKAQYWYLKAAEQGSRSAQLKFGKMYWRERGVSIDEGKALMWYEEAMRRRSEYARDQTNEFDNSIPDSEELQLQPEPRQRPRGAPPQKISLGDVFKSLFGF
ncbi:hypothetical protein BKA57DRAFT_509821 [Linnemannia elongata]|nr:hypothetical protein BKA57DRAFT_509821 [Linnemannia elongata]